MVYLEVLLAPHPIFVILCHFERVFDWRKRLNWRLVNKVAFEEVVFEVEAKHWFGHDVFLVVVCVHAVVIG